MKISKVTISATIPTGNYANVQPIIELSEVTDIKEAEKFGMDFIKDMYMKYGTLTLVENEIESSIDKIKKIGI